MDRRWAALLVAMAVLILGPAAAAAAKTVHIKGKAYSFNHSDVRLAGATIRVREMPRRSALTDANGDYDLKVPNRATVTPYIEPGPGFNEIDLQTFHTRGRNIRHANFQTPADAEYQGLAALLGVELGPDGRPLQCVVVSTASARNVRGVPFGTFVERTPHGVAGATASRGSGAAGADLLQRFGDPRSRSDRDLRRRGDRLDRGSGRHLPADRRPSEHGLRELPRHLRAGPGGQREPALGPL